jgi:hypothetical protein
MTDNIKEEPEVSDMGFDFAEIRRKNEEKMERLKKQRLQENDSVKLDYRIIPNKR